MRSRDKKNLLIPKPRKTITPETLAKVKIEHTQINLRIHEEDMVSIREEAASLGVSYSMLFKMSF